MTTTALVFDHRGRAGKDGEGPLEVRITANRRSYYISTGIRMQARDWRSGRYVDMPYWAETKKRLDIVRSRIESEVTRCVELGLPIESAKIRAKAWAQIDDSNNEEPLVTWIESQIPLLNVGEGTKAHYRTLVMRLRAFGQLSHWQDLTPERICEWDAWLHHLPAPVKESELMQGKPQPLIGDGTVYNHHKCLKAMLRRAVVFDKIAASPYDKLYGQFRRGDVETVECLTEEELARIEKLHPTPGSTMELVRDLFVFQAYTGLAFSDMQAFDMADYRKEGELWVNVKGRIKTGVPYTSVLLCPAVEVLEKYGMRVPRIPMTKYNSLLKAMGELVGITKNLHSHVARHTFATMMLANGMKIENVTAMLGHTNIKQTQRYAKVVAASVKADVLEVAKTLRKNGKK